MDALLDHGVFDLDALRISRLGDDHLTALAVRSLGFELADFAPDPHPLAVAWKGLPLPPEEVLRRGKKIVHSVKSHRGSDEGALRDFFARARPTLDSP